MNKVAEQCKVDNHHPEWSNVCASLTAVVTPCIPTICVGSALRTKGVGLQQDTDNMDDASARGADDEGYTDGEVL